MILDSKILSTDEILEITDNKNGIELTSNMALNPYKNYYHDLVSSIADLDFTGYIFVPYGSGHLFGSFINYRDFYEPDKLHLIGGVTYSKSLKADKLYAPYNPFSLINHNFIYTKIGLKEIGDKSTVIQFEESSLLEAMDIMSKYKIDVEPSGLGGFAAMINMHKKNMINKKDKKMILLTGKSEIYSQLLDE